MASPQESITNSTSLLTVQSFSRLKGYPDGSRDKAEAWEISKYEYSEDGINWTTGKPSMVASVTEQGAGGSCSRGLQSKIDLRL